MTTTATTPATTADAPLESAAPEPQGIELGATEHKSPQPEGVIDPAESMVPVRFQKSVSLSKGEVFGACQALADADRLLVRTGGRSEASALGDLFELLESRLTH